MITFISDLKVQLTWQPPIDAAVGGRSRDVFYRVVCVGGCEITPVHFSPKQSGLTSTG